MDDMQARCLERWALQAGARQLLPGERVALCLRRVVPGCNTVDVYYAERVKQAHYKNLVVCGSVWMCPICAAKITERRRLELTEAIDRAEGLQTALVTFTMHHTKHDNLVLLLNDLLDAYRFLKAGKRWTTIERDFQIVGSIRSLEVTHWLNGWHPHCHVMFFFYGAPDLAEFSQVITSRWLDCLDHFGRSASQEHGVDVRTAASDVAQYIAKFGKEPKNKQRPFRWTQEHELTKAPSKKGTSEHKTPTQLLIDYVMGDRASGVLFREYALAFKGKAQLVWSRGLRDALSLGEEESDEELAQRTEEPSILLLQLSLAQWRIVIRNNAGGRLLEVANQGEPMAVIEFVKSLAPRAHAGPVGRSVEMQAQAKAIKQTAKIRREKREWLDRLALGSMDAR